MDGTYAKSARDSRISVGHGDRPRLMAGGDEGGARGDERIGDLKVAAAQETENTGHAHLPEGLSDYVGDLHGIVISSSPLYAVLKQLAAFRQGATAAYAVDHVNPPGSARYAAKKQGPFRRRPPRASEFDNALSSRAVPVGCTFIWTQRRRKADRTAGDRSALRVRFWLRSKTDGSC